MKQVVALTNNWADYGGMDVYMVNLGGKSTMTLTGCRGSRPRSSGTCGRSCRATATRRRSCHGSSRTSRCGVDRTRNLPRSAECSPQLLSAWIAERAAFVKSAHPDHLVTWGGEGAFSAAGDDWAYHGSEGGDFDREIALPDFDYGVFHGYPQWWSKSLEWGNHWVRDHAASMRRAGKPVVHKEYGGPSHPPAILPSSTY